MEFDRPGEMSPEKDCWWWLTFQNPKRKSSSESVDSENDFCSGCWNVGHDDNSPSQDSFHLDDQIPSKYLTCLDTVIFILLSIFSLVETISFKIWERPLS